MPKGQPKLTQNIFEARYEQGYRYLDRCGDAMIILEGALPGVSDDKLWMPEEMVPKGARMKCPELDITLVFDAYRLCVDQNPVDVGCPFEKICQYAFSTVLSKFDLGKTIRLGNRKRYTVATDSVEQAELLSIKKAPFENWPVSELGGMKPKSCDATSVLQSPDNSKGLKFSIAPVFKTQAPLRLDRRLTVAPHLLKEGQKEALIAQIKRQRQREQDPLAGLEIDIDYWWLKPEEPNIEQFLSDSGEQMQQIISSFLEK